MSATFPAVSDLKRSLEDLAADPVPAPRAAFLESLEQRLRALDHASAVAEPAIRSSRSRRPLALAIAAVVVLIAGVGVRATDDNARDRIRTTTPAEGDGSSGASDRDGDGSSSADSSSGARNSNGSAGSKGSAGSSSSSATAAGDSEHAGSGETGTTSEDAPGPATVTPIEGQGPAQKPGTFVLRGNGTAARVFLDWDRYEGEAFAAYLVLRSIAPDDPEYPTDNQKTLMMLRIEDRNTTTHQETPKVGSSCRYRIVVVDDKGRELARSNVIDPTASPGPTTGTPRADPPKAALSP